MTAESDSNVSVHLPAKPLPFVTCRYTLQLAFRMYRPNGLFETVTPYRDRNRQFARTLCNGDYIHVFTRNGRKDAARQSLRATHSLAHNSEQANIAVHGNVIDVAVGKFQGQGNLNRLDRLFNLIV